MAIHKDTFMELMGELETYYKREFTSFALGVWYKHLNFKLTTEEFIAAVERTMVSHAFLPTPEQLIEAVKGNAEVLATGDWELCLKAAARADKTMLSGMSAQGHAALRLVGGLSALGMATEDRYPWIKKEFVQVWKSTKDDVLSRHLSGGIIPPENAALPASRDTGREQIDAVKNLSKIMNFNRNGSHA